MNSEEYKVILEERATKKNPNHNVESLSREPRKMLIRSRQEKDLMIVLKLYDDDFIVLFLLRYCILLINLIYLHEKRYLITFVWVN